MTERAKEVKNVKVELTAAEQTFQTIHRLSSFLTDVLYIGFT